MKDFISFLKALRSRLESPLRPLDSALQFYSPNARAGYSCKERISKIASIAPQKALWVADLGSSWGPLGQMLAKGGAHVCCLDDWAKVYRELAIPLAKHMNVLDKMFFVVGECHKLPFADTSFDLIICGEIIEHMKDARKFVFECSRILKPSGTILFSTPNARNPLRFLSFTFNFYSDRRHGHVHEFNPTELQYLLRSFFLKVVEIVFFNLDLPPFMGCVIRRMPEAFFKHVYRPLNHLLQQIPFLNSVVCAGMIVKCIKLDSNITE